MPDSSIKHEHDASGCLDCTCNAAPWSNYRGCTCPPDLLPSLTSDPVIVKHAERHAATGSTFHVWFPPEAPFDVMERAMDAMAEIAVEIEREGWDTSVWTTRP